MLALVVAVTFVSALAWSGVGLIAFVPLVGLAVFPLQIIALVIRTFLFQPFNVLTHLTKALHAGHDQMKLFLSKRLLQKINRSPAHRFHGPVRRRHPHHGTGCC